VVEQAMDARDANVAGNLNVVAHEASRDRRFEGYRQVGCTGADNLDAGQTSVGQALHRGTTSQLVVLGVGDEPL